MTFSPLVTISRFFLPGLGAYARSAERCHRLCRAVPGTSRRAGTNSKCIEWCLWAVFKKMRCNSLKLNWPEFLICLYSLFIKCSYDLPFVLLLSSFLQKLGASGLLAARGAARTAHSPSVESRLFGWRRRSSPWYVPLFHLCFLLRHYHVEWVGCIQVTFRHQCSHLLRLLIFCSKLYLL